jgi:hypothetical protein
MAKMVSAVSRAPAAVRKSRVRLCRRPIDPKAERVNDALDDVKNGIGVIGPEP